jgi:hypothetical protein
MGLIAPMSMHSVRRQIHNMTVTNAPLRDDVASELLDLGATSLEHGDFHATFVVEMHVQGRLG